MNTIQKDLSKAVTEGLLEKVKDSINRYGIYNSGVYGYYVLLRKSIKLNHTQITKLLLTSAFKEDTKKKATIPANTPLHFAVQDENLEIIEILLDQGANIHARNECGASPLLSAISTGESKILDLLIKKGSKSYNDCYSPLYFAAEQALNNIIEQFFGVPSKRGENPTSDLNIPLMQYASPKNARDKTTGNTPDITNNIITILYLAVRNCHSAPYLFYRDYKVENLENEQTELNCAVCEGLSMIFEDVLNQCLESTNNMARGSKQTNVITTVENLLKYDVIYKSSYDINRKVSRLEKLRIILIKMIQHCARDQGLELDDKEQIVLHFVTKHKQLEIVKLLFILKPIGISETGQTELPEILYSTENTDISIAKVIVLLNESVEVYWPLVNFHPYNIIYTNNVVELFYVYNTEIKCAVKSSTPLHIASYQRNAETIEIMLENGVNVNSQRGNGDTALHIVVERCNIDVVKILLESGADVYSKNENGDTPLHVASKGTDPEIVSILLQYGSPVDSRNVCGNTPLDIAIGLARPEFVKLLLKFGTDISNCNIFYPERPCTTIRRGCIVEFVEINLSEEEEARFEAQKNVYLCLVLHIIMLKIANLSFFQQHQGYIQSQKYNDFKKKCEDEIRALKLEIISNNNLSLYDINLIDEINK